ncbi:MAG: hypothetical protein A2189_01380 [Paenibacillus sp. RIFOXYA1_FULL_44_5]|nr:MAG: hypothetical protein A2189_01380 [Paenibacillus sp. RIFOXYA1_FULL_44_5]
MSINYVCRYCHTPVGQIEQLDISEWKLGFHFLTLEERRDIITYNYDGSITVKSICDYCKAALDENPELALVNSPLQ